VVAEPVKPSADVHPQPKRHAGLFRAAVSGFVLVLVAGAIAWMLASRTPIPSRAEQARRVRCTLHLETFVINLLEPEEKAYLRVGVDLGLDREFPCSEMRNGPSLAQVRDTVLEVLAGTRAEDVLTPEGKRKLKEQILAALQARIPEMGAREVYFTDFLIQR
jgi:flagellar protein FliL